MKVSSDMVFFITGGARGLGGATVRRLHAAGAKIAIADINPDQLEEIKLELKERIITFVCDVSKEEDVKKAVEGTVAVWGTIHVALACAGVSWPMLTLTSKETLNTERFQQTIAINLYGSIYVAKYCSIYMAKNKAFNERGEKGVILFVSSVAAEEGQRGQIAYSASKAALNGLCLPMARDLGRFNIRVAAIAPGIFESPMSGLMPDKLKARLNADTPMGRMGKPEEFAHMVQGMIENSYVNGVRLRIDGATKFSHM
jgi:NAD(P)-dependent dehydrogenase (short-subunit alcohol dehydrogenase family)